ncbi:hypothetical protein FDP25_02135 [Roseovarius sp. A21]|uniref:Uncharacterized protein n=1 Tax=Roseovarius bejariae TaxID=2576383 RepID=A0A844CQH8_9RHOB|nr:hypothetical protein [Roseovarius bejariae]MRU14219.1 hypothetical protein [Roseovarius bejariae]
MINERTWVTAGLVFLGTRDIDIADTANSIRATLEQMGHTITSCQVLTQESAVVVSCCHTLRVTVEQDACVDEFSQQVPRLLSLAIAEDDMVPVPDGRGLTNDMVLTHALRDLHRHLSADYVRWTGHSRLLASTDFLMMTADLPGPIEPQGVRGPAGTPSDTAPQAQDADSDTPELAHLRSFLLAVDANPELTHTALNGPEVEPPLSTPQRLAAWFMAYAVLFLATPVGIALLLVNFLKGENPRLATQAAALTGTFLSFQAMGTTAQAMQTMQSFLS